MILIPFSKNLLSGLFLLLAGATVAQAQRAEIMLTDGGSFNSNKLGREGAFESVAFDHQFSARAGLVFPSKTGIGLFYERSQFTTERKGSTAANPYQILTFQLAVADPQHTIGLELYQKAFVTDHSYMRLGAFWGYSVARTQEPSTPNGYLSSDGFGYGTGLDVSYVFPLAAGLSGMFNTGFHFYKVRYGDAIYGDHVSTLSFPLSVGVNYKFAGDRSPSRQQRFQKGEE